MEAGRPIVLLMLCFPCAAVCFLFRRPRRGGKSPSPPRARQPPPPPPTSDRWRGTRGWPPPAPSAPPRTAAAPSRATRRPSPTPTALQIPPPGLRGLHRIGMMGIRPGTTPLPPLVAQPPRAAILLRSAELRLPTCVLTAHPLPPVTTGVGMCTSVGVPPGGTTPLLTSRCSRYDSVALAASFFCGILWPARVLLGRPQKGFLAAPVTDWVFARGWNWRAVVCMSTISAAHFCWIDVEKHQHGNTFILLYKSEVVRRAPETRQSQASFAKRGFEHTIN